MVLTRPVTKTVISTTEFGQPVYDWIVANTPTPWTALTLQNGWLNHHIQPTATGYRKIGDSVHIRGTVYNGSFAPSALATLPAGYRPPQTVYFTTLSYTGGASTFIMVRLEIRDTGELVLTPCPGAVNQWIPLNCYFSTIL